MRRAAPSVSRELAKDIRKPGAASKTDHRKHSVFAATVIMENGNTYEFDLVTIGAGSGGTRASRFSAQHYGAKVAVVELPFGLVASDDTGGAGGT